jgi:uncharacterized protein YgbK (DUF1537 family)
VEDSTRAVNESQFLNALAPVRTVPVSEVASAVAESKRRLVVLDDDPTGTQTVSGVPVLTTWSVEDLRWALSRDVTAFYVLTNTRSLSDEDARARVNYVAANLVDAARLEGVEFVVASRSDSTLRGHYPLETDVLRDALAKEGFNVDGVVIVPAYIEAGRFTVDSVHWVRSPGGLIRAGESEFARDATFGYESSDLRDYVAEKTEGRWMASDVARITVSDIRLGGVNRVVAVLETLSGGRPVVVDAASDDDLRVLALALLRAEGLGGRLLYRVGPSFVRARAGIEARAALNVDEVGEITLREAHDGDVGYPHGLVVVGSHVAQTTRQLERLRAMDGLSTFQLDVAQLLALETRTAVIDRAIDDIVEHLESTDVVVETSREVVRSDDAAASLAIARSVSAALVDVVHGVVQRRVPSWIVAKGGITSSDIATEALKIRRAWVRGPLLDGIVSLWEPEPDSPWTLPYVVFAGNVGDDDALFEVVAKLRGQD